MTRFGLRSTRTTSRAALALACCTAACGYVPPDDVAVGSVREDLACATRSGTDECRLLDEFERAGRFDQWPTGRDAGLWLGRLVCSDGLNASSYLTQSRISKAPGGRGLVEHPGGGRHPSLGYQWTRWSEAFVTMADQRHQAVDSAVAVASKAGVFADAAVVATARSRADVHRWMPLSQTSAVSVISGTTYLRRSGPKLLELAVVGPGFRPLSKEEVCLGELWRTP